MDSFRRGYLVFIRIHWVPNCNDDVFFHMGPWGTHFQELELVALGMWLPFPENIAWRSCNLWDFWGTALMPLAGNKALVQKIINPDSPFLVYSPTFTP